MIRKGSEYLDSIRNNREVYINDERVKDITTHPMFKPVVDIRLESIKTIISHTTHIF